MLTLHDCTADYFKIAPNLAAATLPSGVVWIDIFEGTTDEISFVERVTGVHVPSLAELSEIESSSRLRMDRGVLYLNTPIVGHATTGAPKMTPVGFILSPKILITIRFAELTSFTTFTKQLCELESHYSKSVGAFVGLMDCIVDRAADVLEGVGSELDQMSQRIFGANMNIATVQKRPAKESADLREVLRKIGRNGDLVSKIRDSLLGIGRIVPYASTMGGEWFSPELRAHLDSLKYDIVSLSDYDGHLSNKVQLLLDATLGLINIEQNNIIKVLTIVSVVGVPPTLIASLYGMNFHNMPELNWEWGYPYGLALIAISAIAPMLWFKVRGWL